MNCLADKHTHIIPRVDATGVKINFEKEFNLRFGDYVEARDPSVKSNDAESLRSDSAIALWPTRILETSKVIQRRIYCEKSADAFADDGLGCVKG